VQRIFIGAWHLVTQGAVQETCGAAGLVAMGLCVGTGRAGGICRGEPWAADGCARKDIEKCQTYRMCRNGHGMRGEAILRRVNYS
jgi:hypothetical protein